MAVKSRFWTVNPALFKAFSTSASAWRYALVAWEDKKETFSDVKLPCTKFSNDWNEHQCFCEEVICRTECNAGYASRLYLCSPAKMQAINTKLPLHGHSECEVWNLPWMVQGRALLFASRLCTAMFWVQNYDQQKTLDDFLILTKLQADSDSHCVPSQFYRNFQLPFAEKCNSLFCVLRILKLGFRGLPLCLANTNLISFLIQMIL